MFICGSLEPGKDGVGDYTRRLCAELAKQGVLVSMLAYNDKHLTETVDKHRISENTKIPCLRLPHTYSSKLRCEAAKLWVDDFNPDWVSLQFVPYSYHDKGIPFRLASQLKMICGTRKFQVMFHELWLGMNKQDSFKQKIIGVIQKKIITNLITSLNVKIVNTQSQLYNYMLQNNGNNPKLLPLFSNIPNVETKTQTKNNNTRLVVFGGVREGAPKEELANEIVNFINNHPNNIVSLTLVGKSGKEQQNWADTFKSKNIEVYVIGEASEFEVSRILNESDYGIATTPLYLIEKSGTVAAMLEHNLPILVVAKQWKPIFNFNMQIPNGIMEYKTGNFETFLNSVKKDGLNYNRGVTFVAERFLSFINAS
ncbi:hypothetical protein PW52_12460 [Tamlana sedimentorum]|uniref:Glycosyl transferase family 1 domain-containing protein n=2 Tax=Neotamlana sedimentorum TaxID=1435349 RepID=A0A0D7W7D8_9FLAO|nr:hypothetical protein PW52_12460 [Tamlana sedimentorum]